MSKSTNNPSGFPRALLNLPSRFKKYQHNKKQAKSLEQAKQACKELLDNLDKSTDYTTADFGAVLCSWIQTPFTYFIPEDPNVPTEDIFSTKDFPVYCQALETFLAEAGYAELFVKIATALQDYTKDAEIKPQGLHNFNLLCWGLCNFVDESKKIVGMKLAECGGINLLIQTLVNLKNASFRSETSELVLTRCKLLVLSILGNCCEGNEMICRQTNCADIVCGFIQSENIGIKAFSVILLAMIANEHERELMNSADCVTFLVKLLQAAVQSPQHMSVFVAEDDRMPEPMKLSFSVSELLRRLNRLAINDSNKLEIYRLGVAGIVTQILDGDFKEEDKEHAVKILWNVSFVENIRTDRTVQGSTRALRRMQSSDNTTLREASSYALWEIENNQLRFVPPTRSGATKNPPPTYEDALRDQPKNDDDGEEPPPSYQEAVVGIQEPARNSNSTACHLMISYQFNPTDFMRAKSVKERLIQEGFKVWMDETSTSDIATITKAVETSKVVLLCMSEKYKDSSFCRSEAAYAYKLKRHVIPLMVGDRYEPDGWLAQMVGTQSPNLRFCSVDDAEYNMPLLVEAIEKTGEVKRETYSRFI